MFIDRAKILVQAGNGGDGHSGFRREKFIPKGGPSGGDGGRGGSIYLIADENINTLIDFKYKRKFVAKNGERGGTSNCYGLSADDIFIKVPIGTLVKNSETNILLADLKEHGQTYRAAKGGRGGRGNAKFANSVHRAPIFAEKGEPGDSQSLFLELKLLADIGLVGYPSVGKSSIINTLQPDLILKTGTISEAHLSGKHTTTNSEMYELDFGGYIIDTPGIKGFGVLDMEKEEIGHYFPEIFRKLENCQFYNCTHTHEPNCEVKKAVEKGEIALSRYETYLGLLNGEEKYRN